MATPPLRPSHVLKKPNGKGFTIGFKKRVPGTWILSIHIFSALEANIITPSPLFSQLRLIGFNQMS